jgi:hypothetical protein
MHLLPHTFPTLRHAGGGAHRRTTLVIGAGMSHSLVLGPHELCRQKRLVAERTLGVVSSLPDDDFDLYNWADEMIKQLTLRGNANPKLSLAQALGITSELQWKGCVRSERNTARHRIVARFAREGLWEQIWSLNWDCIQESALENVGIRRKPDLEGLPWPTAFDTYVTAADCRKLGVNNNVQIVKPHGCVMAVCEAEDQARAGNQTKSVELAARFLITSTELSNLDRSGNNPAQNYIFASLTTKIASNPLVILGWSISEEYLIEHLTKEVGPILQQCHSEGKLAPDELSVVDIAFNNRNHTKLAGLYNMTPAQAHIPVQAVGFNMDSLFLWLQAIYALTCLQAPASNVEKGEIDALLRRAEDPLSAPSYLLDWVDNFLPVWVRLCWRCGLFDCCNQGTNAPITPEEIPLECRDEHVPWRFRGVPRKDLQAAAKLLLRLEKNNRGPEWDYQIYPGGLFDAAQHRLIIPVPAWRIETMNDLRGLKPLMDEVKRRGAGFIDTLSLLPLPEKPVETSDMTKLKELVARQFPLPQFADHRNINEIELNAV